MKKPDFHAEFIEACMLASGYANMCGYHAAARQIAEYATCDKKTLTAGEKGDTIKTTARQGRKQEGKIMKQIEIMIDFIENEINENSKFCNAIACDGDFQNELIVKIKTLDGKKQKDVYKLIVTKALEIDGIIKSTCPGNLNTVLRF